MNEQRKKPTVLFVCERNAGRSQMAEGFLNAMYGDRFRAYSAGISPATVSPLTVKVMKEAGVDISHQASKSLEIFRDKHFSRIVVLCDKECIIPDLPASDIPAISKHFPDPKSWQGDEDEILNGFRIVRNGIRKWVRQYFGSSGK
ncbi:MAG TPA: arsenate reductase ArsC [Methanoregulaceae archaeon]|nr:arsenate reductase ArsC [Methanoregulaceae archaeon]